MNTPRSHAFATRAFAAFALAAAAGVASQAAHAQCAPQWLAPLPPPGVEGRVYDLTSWDSDGGGPLPPWLVVGGCIESVDGIEMSNVAAWDGVNWHSMSDITGPSRGDVKGAVYQLESFDVDGDGPEPATLFAFGCVDRTAESYPIGLQRFMGDHWEMLIQVGNTYVARPLVQWAPYDDGRLPRQFAFGTQDRIHVFDGSEWTQIPARNAPGLDADVRALKALIPWDPDGNGPAPREIVGAFQRQSDENIVRLARWDGSAWSFITGDISVEWGRPLLNAWDPDGRGPRHEQLLMLTDGAWQWFDGTEWRVMEGVYGYSFQPFDLDGDGPLPEMLVNSDRKVWDGTTVQILPASSSWPGANALSTWDPDGDGPQRARLVGGGMNDLGSPTYAACNGVAIYDGGNWSPIGRGLFGPVFTVARHTRHGQNGLVAVGWFENAGNVRLDDMGFFDGATWQPLPFQNGKPKAVVSWNDDGNDATPPILVASVTPDYSPVQFRALLGDIWHHLGATVYQGKPVVASLSGSDADLFCIANDFWYTPQTLREWVDGEWVDYGEIGGYVSHTTSWVRGDETLPRPILVLGLSPSADARTQLKGWDGEQFIPVGDVLTTSTSDYATLMSLTSIDFDGDGPEPQQLVAIGQFDHVADGGPAIDHVAILTGDHWQPVAVSPEWTAYWADPDTQYVAQFTACVWDPDGNAPVAPTLRIYGTRRIPYSSEIVAWEYDGETLREIGVGAPGEPWTAIQWDPDGPGPIPPRIQVAGSIGASLDRAVRGSVFEAFLDDATPWVATPPQDASGFEGDTITLTASVANGYAELDGGVQFQWRRDGLAIQDGPAGASPNGGTVLGASGTLHLSIPSTLTITNAATTDNGDYDLVVTNSCGTLSSATARIEVTPFCAADFDASGTIDATDLAAFFTAYETGAPNADVDRSGGIDASDLGAFFAAYESGC